MLRPPELEALPATAPWLMHSLRTLFDARRPMLQQEALQACMESGAQLVPVKFIHRCMEVTAVYDKQEGRFTELRACDVGEVEWERPTYCITMNLRPDMEE
jgi:hypothetical protein